METLKAAWRVGRWLVVGLVLVGSAWLFFDTVRQLPEPQNVPFDLWYGNWLAVLIVSAVFTLFLIGFTRPRLGVEWRNAGVYTAFLISLFTEMFGIPLTIYLLAPFLDLQPSVFGLNESHLWAFALDQLGLLPLYWGDYLLMVVSMGLIAAGVSLLAVGWATIYRGRARLVTDGIYRYLRHPQYFGLILIVLAFNIQWPTLLTVLMSPVLIVMYLRLARWEDTEMATFFGEAFVDYATRTPAFVPFRRARPTFKSQSPGLMGRRHAGNTDDRDALKSAAD